MSAVDIAVLVIVVVYFILGIASGLIRRVIGFLVLFLAFGAATYLGPDGGRFLQQGLQKGVDVADARIYAFYGFALLVIVLIEGLAAAYHNLLQFSFVPLDRVTGAIAGIVTGLIASVLVVFTLNAAGNPANANPSLLQSDIRDSVNSSVLHTPLLRGGRPILAIFSPVLPSEPDKYFSPPRLTG